MPGRRPDYELIEEHVEPGARVLDLGCGDGLLLEELIEQKGVDGWGIDVDLEACRQCIERGVPVYHGDMLEGMAILEDRRFDWVILSQTLQQTSAPLDVIREMVRVGRRALISIPNFGHWKVRLSLVSSGRMPVTRSLPYNWYDTPNIHLLTIRDFFALCAQMRLRIVDRMYLTPGYRRVPGFLANLFAGMAIFVVESRPAG